MSPDPEWQEAYDAFVAYRKTESGKTSFGELAATRLRRKCERLHALGYDVTELLDHACVVGWLSIYPQEDFRRKARPAAHSYGKPLSIVGVEVDPDLAKAALVEARKAVK